MSIFNENTEHEDRPEFDDNGEPIIYIEEDVIPDEFASEYDGVIDLDVQDDSFYETVWGGDASSVATLAADDSTTGEEVTDPLEVEVEQDTKDTKENDGILEQANEDYNNAVDILIDVLTQALAQGEITEEMNASILDAQGTKTKNEQIIKEICNVQEDNSILKQLADIKANMVAASVDDILDILTQGGTKPWLYKDSDNNVLVDGQSIPELTVLVNKLNLIATGGDEASEIQLTPEFINLISTSDIKLQAKNITLEGLVTANDNFKILEDGSIVANNGTFTGKVFIGNNGSVIDDSALSDGIQQGAKDGTLAVQKLEIVNADIKNLKADKADITDLNATNAKIENLTANKADIEYLTANYATINLLNTNVANINKALIGKANVSDLTATNAVVEDLKAGKADIADLTAVSAKVTDLQANKADISVLEANYATIKQLDATNANVGTLQAETANINKALIDKANVSDLNATNANVTNLQATKANVTDLNAANANINTLTGNLAEITTLVNGNLTSDNIQSMVITGDKFTVENGFIKNAMIDSINANKINTGTINTNNVKIQSNDGSMILQGNLQQFKDKNGKVRIQLGKDAKGNFTFVLYDENGTGQLINEKGIQSSNAIADGLIVDSKVADNANIAGSKLDIDSVVTEVNNGTTSIKGTKIYLDDQKQALNVAFNNMSTTVKGNTNTIQSHTTSINTMNGKVTQLISDTTITKQDGTTTSLKDAYNATVDTVDSHSTKIGSLETNLATANNNISSVSSKQATLEQNLNGFKQTVSDTYTTKADFNNLTIGGTNLVTGTKDFYNWFYDGFALRNDQYDGTFKGCYIKWTGTSGYKDVSKNDNVYLEPNTEYTLSFWARGNGKFWSYLYKSGVVIASGYNSSGASTTSPDGAIVTTLTDNDKFKRYWITWKTVSNLTPGKYNVIPCRVAANLGNCSIIICGVKLEKGNKATAWTPAPQDIDSAISNVDGKFASYSTTQQMNTAINQKADSITQSVSKTYATKTDLNTANGNISSLTNRMQSAESKLTKDSLTTTIGNYYTTSTDVNGLITNKGYATTSQVSQTATDLTAKFKSTGGINLIRNSTAIGGTNGWQGNIAYSEADSVGKVTGNRRFFYINNKNTTENYAFSPRFALKANTTYTLSCWIYRNPQSTGYDIFVLASTNLPWTNTSTGYNNAYHMHVGSATGWERVEKTFTTGANDISGYVRIDNNGYTGSGDANVANVHFGSLMLTEGTIAHPWTPHPSECYSGITQIDGQGIKVMHDSIDSNSYTHMSPTGFYLKNKGTDIFKVDGNGLYIKGNGDFTGKVTASSGAIGGYIIGEHNLVGANVGMSSTSGNGWAFWAGADGAGNSGNAPFRVGHNGNLYATNATISGTINSSTINSGTINGSVINGSTINSDSFIGDMLAIDGTISAKSLQVQDIDNAKYPGAVTADFKLYVSTNGNDDSEIENGATFATFDGLLDKLPKNLNGHEVRIEMSTNITENVDFKGFFGGKIRLYMKGHTLYGYVVSRMGSARINICSGYIGNASDTSNGWGKIHPSKGYAVSAYTTTVASVDQGAIGLYNIDVYGADNYLSGSTTKLGVAAQDWGTAYLNGVSYYGCNIGARANAGGRIHDVLSYNVCTKYGFYATTGGYITLAGSAHSGGKSKNYHEADAGKVIVDADATFASGEASTPGGTAPVVPTTKTITIKSTYGDTYRSSVYNSWKKDGTVRQGDYGYGDCNGCWFFGDAFSDVEGKAISKVTIKITRQSGGSSSAVGLVVKSHGHSSRPSGAPTFRTTAGTLSLATGASGTLTITNSTILNEIKSGAVKGFGIQTTYDSSHYAVCSGSVTVKITYTE